MFTSAFSCELSEFIPRPPSEVVARIAKQREWTVCVCNRPHHLAIDGEAHAGSYHLDSDVIPTRGGTRLIGRMIWRPRHAPIFGLLAQLELAAKVRRFAQALR